VKILYVSQYFPPEMGAPAARVAELSRRWVEARHSVTVLTGFPNHPTGRVPPEYRRKLRGLVMREEYHGVKVIRTWLLPLPNRKAYERIFNYSSFLLSSAITGLFIRKPDVLIATSPQLLVALSGCWLACWKRVPFVFEVRDLWPESLAAVGVGNEKSILHRALGRIAGFLYKRANLIVVVTPAFKEHLAAEWSVPADKIALVENAVETELFKPVSDPGACSGLRKSWSAENKFVVSYIGTLGMAHGLDVLLESASQLRIMRPDILFVLIGEGADKDRIKASARDRGLDNILFVDEQPREIIPTCIAASDVCVVSLKQTEIFKTVIPTKMLEFMACERPVILSVGGLAKSILNGAGAGMSIAPESPSELTFAIEKLAGDPDLRTLMGHRGREYILRNFSREQAANRYIEILEELLAQ
jgi:colanic acid biosynthesis glycosyl transferase WcaI